MVFEIWEMEFERNKDLIQKGESVEISIRDAERCWKKVKAVFSTTPVPDSNPVRILGEGHRIRYYEAEPATVYIKVLSELSEDLLTSKEEKPGGWFTSEY